MSSNPLMMNYEGGDLTALSGAACAGGRAAARSLCVCRLWVRLWVVA